MCLVVDIDPDSKTVCLLARAKLLGDHAVIRCPKSDPQLRSELSRCMAPLGRKDTQRMGLEWIAVHFLPRLRATLSRALTGVPASGTSVPQEAVPT